MQHNKVIHIVLYFIIYLGGKQAYSQSVYARVEGKVIDNAGKGISNSKISLISLTDTSVYYCTSETDGKFSIYSIKSYGRYLITVDHIGFAKFVKVIDFTSQYNNIGKLIMIDSAVFMQEIIISNKRKAFIKNKDTIEYDAKYFKTNADMDAIYLLNKMPGFDISGKIKIDGDSAKVAINGILYFGDDPRKILGLIPAGVIEKIQVYNDSTKDGTTANFFERNKIINIVTKKNYFSVPKGKVYGGLGHNLFYLLGGNVFLQNEKLQISANGAINKGQIPFNKSFDATSQFESSGIPIAKDFNANLKYQLSKKTTFSFDYSLFNNKTSRTENSTYNYYLDSNSNIKNASTSNINRTSNSVVAKIENIKKNRTISYSISGRASDESSSNTIMASGNFFSNNYSLTKKRKVYNLSNTLNYNNTIGKSKNTVSVRLPISFSNTGETTTVKGSNVTIDTSIQSNFRNENTEDGHSFSPELGLAFTLNKVSRLNLKLMHRQATRYSQQDKNNYAALVNTYADLDTLYSKNTKSNQANTSLSASYIINTKKHTLSITPGIVRVEIKGRTIQNLTFTRRYYNLNPKIEYKYTSTNSRNISLLLEKSNVIPQVEDLNPLLIYNDNYSFSIGNFHLTPSRRYDARLTYDFKNISKESYTGFGISSILIQNYIQDNYILPTTGNIYYEGYSIKVGEQLKYKDNRNDYKYLRCHMKYDFPLKPIQCVIKLGASATYTESNNTINYISSNNNYLEMQFSSQISSVLSKTLDFNIYGKYSRVELFNNKLARNLNSYSLNTFLTYDFLKKMNLKLETNFNTIRSIKYAVHNNFFIADLTLSKKFLPKNQLTVSLLAHDIFNSYSRYSIENRVGYTADIYTNNIRRYFLLMLAYNY